MESSSDSRKIFVGGLSLNTTQQMLSQYFGGYGGIEDAIVMTDKITGRPRGFGFVTFRDQEAVEKVLLEAHSIDGRTVECKRAVPLDQQMAGSAGPAPLGGLGLAGMYGSGGLVQGRPQPYSQHPSSGMPYGVGGGLGGGGGGGTLSQRAVQGDGSLGAEDSGYNPKKIFAGGLPASCDEAKLRSYFSKYGGIVDCVVMIDRVAQRHRGFGYVTFEDPKSVDQCMAEHDSHQIDGKWIDVKRCVIQDPAQRKQQGYPTQAAGPIRRRTDQMPGYGGVGDVMGGAHAGHQGYYYNAPVGGYGGMSAHHQAGMAAAAAAAGYSTYPAANYGMTNAGGYGGYAARPAGAAGPAAGGMYAGATAGRPLGAAYGRAGAATGAGPAGAGGAAGGYAAYGAGATTGFYSQGAGAATAAPYYGGAANVGAGYGAYAGYAGGRTAGGATDGSGGYYSSGAAPAGYYQGATGAAGAASSKPSGSETSNPAPGAPSGGYRASGGVPPY